MPSGRFAHFHTGDATNRPDGSYIQRTGMGAKHSQQLMIERTERRLKEATRLRRRKVQSTTSRKKR